MRVLILSQYYLPQPLANAETVAAIAEGLAGRGHDVTVVTPAPGATSTERVDVARSIGWFARNRSSIPARLVEYLLFSVGAVVGGIRAPRADVVVVPSPPPTMGLVGLIVARRHRAPMIYNAQDLYPEIASAVSDTSPLLTRPLQRLMRWIFRQSAAVVVIDPAFVPTIKGAEPRATVLPVRNGIDLGPFDHAARSSSYLDSIGVAPDATIVMYAGNIGRSQDLRTAVLATADAGTTFVVHGGGAGLDDLRAWVVAEGHAHVHFSAFADRSRLGAVFASADVHLVPLRPAVAAASLPSKLLSIFASGRPAILCAEDGTAAAGVLAEAGGGWRVSTGLPADELAATIRAVLADPDELEAQARAGQLWVREHGGVAAAAVAWERVLRDVVHS